MKEVNYPGVGERLKAAMIDAFVAMGLMIIVSYIFSSFDEVSNQLRMASMIGIIFLYEPLLVSLFSATIGHSVAGIKVVKDDGSEGKVFFLLVVLRYAVKIAFGWVSLLTILGNSKNKAIHDMLVKSIVIFSK